MKQHSLLISQGRKPHAAPRGARSHPLPDRPDPMLRLVDGGLLAIIFVTPLFMGGRGEIGKLALVAAICATTLCWTIRQCLRRDAFWRWSGAEILLLLGMGWIMFQLVPLPQSWLLKLSPEIGRILPLWTTAPLTSLKLGSWNQLSLFPQATRGGLVVFIALGMLFLVLIQRLHDTRDIERLLRWLALAAIGMAMLGMLQLLLGNGRFLWIFAHPSRDTYGAVKGTFQNQNHCAHFLILGLGPLVWWWQSLVHQRRPADFHARSGAISTSELLKHFLAGGIGLVVLAVLLTFSRGGIVALGVAGVVLVVLQYRLGLLTRRWLLYAGGPAILIASGLVIYGYQPLAGKLSSLTRSASLEELSRGRDALWRAHLRAIPQFAWTGTGVGSHREIYRTYLTEHFDFEFTHGESGYLHILLETGVPGLALLLAGWALVFRWCLRPLINSGSGGPPVSSVAVLPGLVASFVHALADFVWFIPACMTLTIALAACACRLCQLTADARRAKRAMWSWMPGSLIAERQLPGQRLVWCAGVAFVAAMSCVMLRDRAPAAVAATAWHDYFRISRATPRRELHDAEATVTAVAPMIKHLEQVLRHDPENARAHLRMAALYLRQFDALQQTSENPLSLAQIREAALASSFPTLAEQHEWFARVTGENRRLVGRALAHTRRGLRLCPLQGDGYIYLAELAFLEGASAEATPRCVDQALTVRPRNALVLMAAGQEAAVAGDLDIAFARWKLAFHQDPEQQQRLIELLAPQMPAETFLQQFQPDLPATWRLLTYYRRQGRQDAVGLAADWYADLVAAIDARGVSRGVDEATVWNRAREANELIGRFDRAADYARKAVYCSPEDVKLRRSLITTLLRIEEYDAAVRELRWLLAKFPGDAALEKQLESVAMRRVATR